MPVLQAMALAPGALPFMLLTWQIARVLRILACETTAKGLVAMSEVVNLNKYHKQRRRAEAQRQAAANRVHFGRNKAERTTATAEQERQSRTLDGKRLEDANSDDVG